MMKKKKVRDKIESEVYLVILDFVKLPKVSFCLFVNSFVLLKSGFFLVEKNIYFFVSTKKSRTESVELLFVNGLVFPGGIHRPREK